MIISPNNYLKFYEYMNKNVINELLFIYIRPLKL